MPCTRADHNALRAQAWKYGKDLPCDRCEFLAPGDEKPLSEVPLPKLYVAQVGALHMVTMEIASGHQYAIGGGYDRQEALDAALEFHKKLGAVLQEMNRQN